MVKKIGHYKFGPYQSQFNFFNLRVKKLINKTLSTCVINYQMSLTVQWSFFGIVSTLKWIYNYLDITSDFPVLLKSELFGGLKFISPPFLFFTPSLPSRPTNVRGYCNLNFSLLVVDINQ